MEKDKIISHIQQLKFIDVEFKFISELLSQPNMCHQNCEEYNKVNSKVQMVHGWLEQVLPDHTKQYVLHSCIIDEDGTLKDITSWKAKAQRCRFAVDDSIIFNDQNKKEFEFSTEILGRLPLEIDVDNFTN